MADVVLEDPILDPSITDPQGHLEVTEGGPGASGGARR